MGNAEYMGLSLLLPPPSSPTMSPLLLLLLPLALASQLEPYQQELVDRYGEENVSFDRNVRTAFCDQCMEITVESSGGAQEHQPNRLGRFKRDGSLWENMVPFWTSDNKQHITPDPMSNPIIYFVKWVVSETVGGFNAGIMNDEYTDGINCPYEIPDQWQYQYDRQWFVDPTLRVRCSKFREN